MEITKNKIVELINAVDEENLTKEQLERYYDDLSILFAKIQVETADIEKESAIFFSLRHKELDTTDVSIKREWNATQMGQRAIDLKSWGRGLEKLLRSVKNRIYASL